MPDGRNRNATVVFDILHFQYSAAFFAFPAIELCDGNDRLVFVPFFFVTAPLNR